MVIFSAGVTPINSSLDFFKISEKEWNEVIKSQLNSTFLSCQVFGQYMVKNKKGSIINISSASSGPPLSRAFAYSASKSAINKLEKIGGSIQLKK